MKRLLTLALAILAGCASQPGHLRCLVADYVILPDGQLCEICRLWSTP